MEQEQVESAVIAKLKAEGLSLLSSWKEIEKCLKRTAQPTLCIVTAKRLIREYHQI